MRPTSIFFALASVVSVLAAPVDNRLEDIQCRCLSYATDAKPTLCTYMDSHRLDWHTASSLASDYDLKLQFASQSTITKVLAIHRPLPSSVLQRLKQAEVASSDATGLRHRENKIVCGFRDEITKLGTHDRSFEPECHLLGYMVAAFTLLLFCYVVGDYIWTRFLSPDGAIYLEGDEKALMAEYDSTSTNTTSPTTPTDNV